MIDYPSIDRFIDLVATYGADPQRWPADRRSAAVRCLVESEAARAAWSEAADLDGDLDCVPSVNTSPQLMENVLAIADAPKQRNTGRLPAAVRQFLPYAIAATIALVVGLSVPSPFRDATGAPPQNQAAVPEPAIVDDNADTSDGLTTLALVDFGIFADDETDASGESSGDSPLSALPLQ